MLHIKNALDFEAFFRVLFRGDKIELDEMVLERISKSYEFLKEFSENKIIYGVNTGFGPMAQYRIKDKDREQLQYNLIRSHAAGMGKTMEPLYVKALMLARLN